MNDSISAVKNFNEKFEIKKFIHQGMDAHQFTQGDHKVTEEKHKVFLSVNPNTFFRIHNEYNNIFYILIDSRDGKNPKLYLVGNNIVNDLDSLDIPEGVTCKESYLLLCIDRLGKIFLWAAKIPAYDWDLWGATRMSAINKGMNIWIKMKANHSKELYEITEKNGEQDIPAWPVDLNFDNLVANAFEGRIISSLEHPFIASW